jgi:hypothetical protein
VAAVHQLLQASGWSSGCGASIAASLRVVFWLRFLFRNCIAAAHSF